MKSEIVLEAKKLTRHYPVNRGFFRWLIRLKKKNVLFLNVPLAGERPSSMDPPSGCTFHPRCPNAAEICSQKNPEIRQIGETMLACYVL